MNGNKGNSKVLFLVAVLAVVICAVFFILLLDVRDKGEEPVPENTVEPTEEVASDEWVTYTNEEYGFSIEHPADWVVAEFPDDEISPKFNIYVPETVEADDLPLTHHSEGATHVSIFPQGVPTEGFLGSATESTVDFAPEVEQARDYMTADGTRFATIAFMPEGGPNWQPWGFVFAHVTLENATQTCEPIDPDMPCDPLTNGTIVRTGSVNEAYRDATVRMLESFRFE